MGQFIQLQAADGQSIPAYVAQPSGQPKGGIVVIQEIFGVNSHVQSVVDFYAAQGFLAAAPTEEACGRCDFRPVCGSDVFRRVARKPPEAVADLLALRERP